MKNASILCKILSLSLAFAVVGGAAAASPIGTVIDTCITVSAASASPVVTVGDFRYVLYSDKTAKIVGYTGTKDKSTVSFGIPSVIYSKDIDTTWSYNDYISSYNITQLQASVFSGCRFKTLSLPRFLESINGGFTGAEIGGFFIDSSNTNFSSTYYSGAYALYSKDNTALYAYPSNPGLYVSGFGTATKGFPSTLTKIEDQAFAGSKLSTVTIPSRVTYMGDKVFTDSNVQTVTFEGNSPTFSLMSGSSAANHGTFEGASRLYRVTINGTDGDYTTDAYGVIYNKNKTKLVLVPQGRNAPFNLTSTCTEIGDYAFYRSDVNGPVIYDQVNIIGANAFTGVKSNFKVYCLKDTFTDTFVQRKNIPYAYAYEYTTPEKSGHYNVVVYVKDDRNITASKKFSVNVMAPVLTNETTVTAETANVGDSITVSGKASGGEGGYEYSVSVSYDGGEFVTVSPYSSEPDYTYQPEAAGSYIIRSFVKGSAGTEKYKDFTVTVSEKTVGKLVNTSKIQNRKNCHNTRWEGNCYLFR